MTLFALGFRLFLIQLQINTRLELQQCSREASALANDIPEESGHFRFLRAVCLVNIKGSVGLILAKASDMRISIPFGGFSYSS